MAFSVFRMKVSLGKKQRQAQTNSYFSQEPTSGLDAALAFKVITTLQSFTVEKNRTLVTTIHQPSSKIFNMFQTVLLLAGGQVRWGFTHRKYNTNENPRTQREGGPPLQVLSPQKMWKRQMLKWLESQFAPVSSAAISGGLLSEFPWKQSACYVVGGVLLQVHDKFEENVTALCVLEILCIFVCFHNIPTCLGPYVPAGCTETSLSTCNASSQCQMGESSEVGLVMWEQLEPRKSWHQKHKKYLHKIWWKDHRSLQIKILTREELELFFPDSVLWQLGRRTQLLRQSRAALRTQL